MRIEVEGSAAGTVVAQPAGMWAAFRGLSRPERLRIGGWAGCIGLLTLAFVQPLARLFSLAMQNDLHSHIPLVPLIVGYLLHTRRASLAADYRSSVGGTTVLCGIGAAALVAGISMRGSLSANDAIALTTLGYVSFVAAGGFLFLGSTWMAAAAFPMAFLIFMVPLPDAVTLWLEHASILASAEATALFLRATGTPLVRDGLYFAIPGIVLHIAQECSGIRSTWVLFITSVLAANLFLDSLWRRLVLVAFVIPLAIVRNAFRILVIALLCVHIGPHMIDSVIHRQGGPIFFVLSLVPLFALLAWLRRKK